MAELHNPLFEDEKEFLERQKLEYERALLGDVDHIKEKTQEAGKYAAIGAGILGGIWLISKAFRSRGDSEDDDEGFEEFEDDRLARKAQKKREKQEKKQSKNAHRAPYVANPVVHQASRHNVDDDHGFGGGHQFDRGQQYAATGRADLAPDVYHASAETDPFPPLAYDDARRLPVSAFDANQQFANKQPNMVASVLQSFLQSDTGKVLTAQVTAVLMAYIAKKVSDYLPVNKNSDLANIPTVTHMHREPETKDIDFTYHHDDADAPQQSL
ncbi:hypothetical protein SAMN00120144_3939 [Hymenobacter roseosalivarius DSM 11622]|uniref:Uncharacterized protein n=1 Tax=Hymenobacter roseosalivarius DSM 11622 TaxID=645990 RepID=A0A1W1UMZ9_9BACT|nr:hypothetical protein [Hymenobacter roseosalivarius]SMB82181.1 hypothetical protein SAMN00120144_3939 [Hymenobacter roseosalivarius DSM 11622]